MTEESGGFSNNITRTRTLPSSLIKAKRAPSHRNNNTTTATTDADNKPLSDSIKRKRSESKQASSAKRSKPSQAKREVSVIPSLLTVPPVAPRPVSPASSASTASPSVPPRGIFSDCRFALFGGVDVGPTRLAIFTEQITKRGGVVLTHIDKTATHIVVPSDYTDYDSWKNTLKDKHLSRIHIHRVDWLIESLKRNVRLPEDKYSIDYTTGIQHIQTLTDLHNTAIQDPHQQQATQRQLFEEQAAAAVPPPSMIPDSPPDQLPALSPVHTSSPLSALSPVSAAHSDTDDIHDNEGSQLIYVADSDEDADENKSISQKPQLAPSRAGSQLPTTPVKLKTELVDAVISSTLPRAPSPSVDVKLGGSSPSRASPTPKTESVSHEPQPGTEYLIDPSLFTSLTTASHSVLPDHPYHTKNIHKLACQQSGGGVINHNPTISNALERLEQMNASLGDKWRTYAYRKAVGLVKQFPRKIETEADLQQLGSMKGMGQKMIQKIREVMQTGKLQKQEFMEADERIKVLETFSRIHGVAGTTAQRWYALGLRTLDDVLHSDKIVLNAQQKLGLKFYEDKQKRVPRSEVTAITDLVSMAAEEIYPGVKVICCGSYRRGKPDSGDVDLLVTHHDFTTEPIAMRKREEFMVTLMKKLNASIVPPFWWQTKEEPIDTKYEHKEAEGGEETEGAVKRELNTVKKEQMKQEETKVETEPTTAGAAAGASPSGFVKSEPTIKSESVKSELQPIKREPSLFSMSSQSALSSSQDFPSSSSSSSSPISLPPFITGSLAPFDRLTQRHAQANFMGFCCLPVGHPQYSGVNRRLDIKVYPVSMFPFALLYFTGSDHFNRSMRFYARKLGWSLSDHGLQPANRVNGEKLSVGDTAICYTEKDVFQAMGLKYIPPTQRNCYQYFDETEEAIKRMKEEEDRESHNNQEVYSHSENVPEQADALTQREDAGGVPGAAYKMEPEDLYHF